jgi:hypothetical protein
MKTYTKIVPLFNDEIKHGERFNYNGIVIKCVEDNGLMCSGCYFEHITQSTFCNIKCCKLDRLDKKDVIFKQSKINLLWKVKKWITNIVNIANK